MEVDPGYQCDLGTSQTSRSKKTKNKKPFRLSDSQHHSNRETGQQTYQESSYAIQSKGDIL